MDCTFYIENERKRQRGRKKAYCVLLCIHEYMGRMVA